MITELMKASPAYLDGELMEAFDNVFQTIMNSGVTKLKPQTRLASLLVYEGEKDIKKRQKYMAVLEEMKTVSTIQRSCVENVSSYRKALWV